MMELNCMTAILLHFFKLMVLQNVQQGANAVQILSRGQIIMVNAGQSMTLECQVYAESYNLFFNPVVWHKTQHSEECPISMMVKTAQPFASDLRFKPSYAPPSQTTLKYIFELSISNVTVEDSGNYSCLIYGQFNSVLASVTYHVLVRVHPQKIIITTNSMHHHQHTSATLDRLIVSENKNITIGCTVTGGYPPVDVQIYVGHKNITNRFSIVRTSHIRGSKCMQTVEQVVKIWSHTVTMSAEDDGSWLKCIVAVPGLPPNVVTSVPVVVRFIPVIDCLPARASVGDGHVNLTCMVKARPEVSSLYWTIKGLNVSNRQLNNEYYTSVRDSPDGILESKLHIRNVTSKNFHTYTIIAENILGSSYEDVILQRKIPSQTSMTRELFLVGMELLQNGSSGEIGVLSRTINSQESRSVFGRYSNRFDLVGGSFSVIELMENMDRFCLLDGGLGTELVNTYGHADINDDPLWSAKIIVSNPDDISKVHKSFLEVGCDIIETATYQASLEGLCRHLSIDASKAFGIIDEGVKICLKARDDYWEKVNSKGGQKPLVAGSIGPYGAHLANSSEFNGHYVDGLSMQELVDWHRPQVERIWQSGVDILAFETIPAQKEAEAIVAVLREVPDAKAWLSFSCQNGKQTCHGESFEDALKTLSASDQITGCGVNCSAPWHINSLLDSIPPIIKETKRILVYPNSGQLWLDNRWSDVDGNHSRTIDSYVDEWIERGASWIGGCCQVTAKELEFVRKAIDKHINKSNR